jgi:NAD(P)-dependent dehydrogenase (short-subunit alcohol dehydrogenase family)
MKSEKNNSAEGPLVLVSGGNRGIGFEACRALAAAGARVLLGARRLAEGEKASEMLAKSGKVTPVALDVGDSLGIEALADRVKREYGPLEVLVNNAGVYLDGGADALSVPEETIAKTLDANLYGPWRLARAFAPGMAARGRGRIVNVSSGMGALSSMGAGSASYRVSKAALNALTLVLAAELNPSGISVISFCPGWVATDMGGKNAPRSPKTAGAELAAAALDDRRSGVFIREGKEIAW